MNFSFAGCGFLGIYHVGVASCLKQHAPQLLKNAKFAGASAGSMVACCLLCDCCLGECTNFTLRLASKARSRSLGPLHPSFDIQRILRDALWMVLPDNAHEIVKGRFFVSLTRVSDREAVIVSDFTSKEELIQALLCSAHVPFYSGLLPPSFRGVRYVDGGLSDNLPRFDEDTITISPFAGESDICPKDDSNNFAHVHLANTSMQLSSWNLYRISRALFPPHPEILSDMCKQGFDDCLNFLQKNNLISCTRHLTVKSTIVPITEEMDETGDEVDGHLADNHHHGDNCDDCRKKKQVALIDTLPPIVAEALQAACDSMNNGLSSYVHRSRTLHVMSLLTVPWVLPFDIVYNWGIRFLDYLPSLPEDLQLMYSEFARLIRMLISHLSHHKRKYTARFMCRLAITELNYEQNEDSHTLVALESPYQPQPIQPVVRNLNFGFAVDFETKVPNSIKSMRELEDQMDHLDINEIELLQSKGPGQNIKIHTDPEHISDTSLPTDEIYDTFEQCLHIAEEMESTIAYHYRNLEANDGTYNVQEIFEIDNASFRIPVLRGSNPNLYEASKSFHKSTESLHTSRRGSIRLSKERLFHKSSESLHGSGLYKSRESLHKSSESMLLNRSRESLHASHENLQKSSENLLNVPAINS